jgi:hypothetical protein
MYAVGGMHGAHHLEFRVAMAVWIAAAIVGICREWFVSGGALCLPGAGVSGDGEIPIFL